MHDWHSYIEGPNITYMQNYNQNNISYYILSNKFEVAYLQDKIYCYTHKVHYRKGSHRIYQICMCYQYIQLCIAKIINPQRVDPNSLLYTDFREDMFSLSMMYNLEVLDQYKSYTKDRNHNTSNPYIKYAGVEPYNILMSNYRILG